MRNFARTIAAALLAGTVAGVMLIALDSPDVAQAIPGKCLEDEALVVTDDTADRECVAIDVLVSAEIEPCIVAEYSEDRERAPVYGDVEAAVLVRHADDTRWHCESATNLPSNAR